MSATGAVDLDAREPSHLAPDISVVMPCLNEAASVGVCIEKAWEGIRRTGLRGEVVVSDNGSSDDSVEVATRAGARVVRQPQRGYGNAYLKGFAEARGRYLIMGDSDGSYDFTQLDRLIEPLRDGTYDYVLGSRFAGKILPGAMPWSHRYIGNPVLTGVLNRLFKVDSSDAHSGMRAFTAEAYERMALQASGMELASEIVINAAKAGLRGTEVPITYHPREGESKLHSMRDGWRHLRFMLLLSPNWLFVWPGLAMLVFGLLGQGLLLPGPLNLGFHAFDVHFSVLCALAAILGYQTMLFGVFARTWLPTEGSPGDDRLQHWFDRNYSLERGLLGGAVLFVVGFMIDAAILIHWLRKGLGPINSMKPALLAMTLMMVGAQTGFASFFLSLLRTERPR
ncbi:MAG TPA: glycosyltransferase family 2 protein [Acidimicrobiales bacterium]|nr:glycosyltransferase family 2 protein [Acidimicrobiales bacterium]